VIVSAVNAVIVAPCGNPTVEEVIGAPTSTPVVSVTPVIIAELTERTPVIVVGGISNSGKYAFVLSTASSAIPILLFEIKLSTS